MSPEDAVPSECPHCKRFDRIVRAVDARQDADEAAVSSVDVALPAHEWWSMLLVGAIAVLMLGSMSTRGAASPGDDNYVALGLTMVALVLGLLGIVRTRHNIGRMRAVEPFVRWYHDDALYCEECSHIHFPMRELPQGLKPHVAWTVPDYRRRLWYACGFVKSGFPLGGR
jgi:hypothetical protein